MLSNDALVPLIVSLEIVGCVILSVWGFSTAQYYRGRFEAEKEADKEIDKLKKELAKKNRRFM